MKKSMKKVNHFLDKVSDFIDTTLGTIVFLGSTVGPLVVMLAAIACSKLGIEPIGSWIPQITIGGFVVILLISPMVVAMIRTAIIDHIDGRADFIHYTHQQVCYLTGEEIEKPATKNRWMKFFDASIKVITYNCDRVDAKDKKDVLKDCKKSLKYLEKNLVSIESLNG